jgi:hypothetical protein
MLTTSGLNRHGKVVYLVLFAIQASATNLIIWEGLPAFRQLLLRPEQIVITPYDLWTMVVAISAAQGAYWYRLRKLPIPFKGENLFANHIFLLWGRLNFIFGGALFAVVAFRHLPELNPAVDFVVTMARAPIFILALFAMFCFSLELERLGSAFAPESS